MKPQSFSNSRIVSDSPVSCLHYFPSATPSTGRPVFIIPPHAGRHGNISQRIAETCVKAGRPTYAFELKPATIHTADTSITDLITILKRYRNFIVLVREHLTGRHDQRIDLIGLCQGAWLGAIYTALFPENISKYANFAGPINTHTGENNAIEDYCKYASLDYHKSMIALHGGIQPGYMQWLSFVAVKPEFVFFERWTELWTSLLTRDEQKIGSWFRNNNWYDAPSDLAGNWFLDCLENHFFQNKLYNGTWEIMGRRVDLGRITCPVYLYAGAVDEITHWKQVFDMAKRVRSEEIHKTLFAGAGHTKVFVGSDELNHFTGEFF